MVPKRFPQQIPLKTRPTWLPPPKKPTREPPSRFLHIAQFLWDSLNPKIQWLGFLLRSWIVYLKVQEIQYHHHTGCIEHVKLIQICIECGNLNQCVLITAWSWSLSKTRGFNSKSRHKQEFIEASFICWHQGCSLLWSGWPEEKNRIRSFHLAGLFETLQFWTSLITFLTKISYFSIKSVLTIPVRRPTYV